MSKNIMPDIPSDCYAEIIELYGSIDDAIEIALKGCFNGENARQRFMAYVLKAISFERSMANTDSD